MKKYKYVVISGCSFSMDPPFNSNELGIPKDGKSYGQLISEYYGANCCNLSLSGSSVPRVLRRALKWCNENGDNWKDTLIIIGLPPISRVEIWSNKLKYRYGYVSEIGRTPWYNDSDYFQYPLSPLDKFEWGQNEFLVENWSKRQRKNYYQNFYSDDAQFLLTTQMVIGLQSFLKVNNIDHVFFDALNPPIDKFWERHCDDKKDELGYKNMFDNLVSQENWYNHPKYESFYDYTMKDIPNRGIGDIGDITIEPDSHPNKKSHEYWSECLLGFISEKV